MSRAAAFALAAFALAAAPARAGDDDKTPPAKEEAPRSLRKGDSVKDVVLKKAAGGDLRLADLKGRVVLLNFNGWT